MLTRRGGPYGGWWCRKNKVRRGPCFVCKKKARCELQGQGEPWVGSASVAAGDRGAAFSVGVGPEPDVQLLSEPGGAGLRDGVGAVAVAFAQVATVVVVDVPAHALDVGDHDGVVPVVQDVLELVELGLEEDFSFEGLFVLDVPAQQTHVGLALGELHGEEGGSGQGVCPDLDDAVRSGGVGVTTGRADQVGRAGGEGEAHQDQEHVSHWA